jgi:hypothetical protein
LRLAMTQWLCHSTSPRAHPAPVFDALPSYAIVIIQK